MPDKNLFKFFIICFKYLQKFANDTDRDCELHLANNNIPQNEIHYFSGIDLKLFYYV